MSGNADRPDTAHEAMRGLADWLDEADRLIDELAKAKMLPRSNSGDGVQQDLRALADWFEANPETAAQAWQSVTAVPPRPDAPDATAGDGPHADCIERGCGSVAGCYPEHCRLDRPTTAGDGLTAEDLIRAARAMDTAGVPADASPEAVTAVALVLRDVLPAAARDAQRVATLEAQCSALQRLAEETEATAARDAERVARVREVADSYGRWPFRVDPLNVTRRLDRALDNTL